MRLGRSLEHHFEMVHFDGHSWTEWHEISARQFRVFEFFLGVGLAVLYYFLRVLVNEKAIVLRIETFYERLEGRLVAQPDLVWSVFGGCARLSYQPVFILA